MADCRLPIGAPAVRAQQPDATHEPTTEAAGRVADFHALRHTYISRLVARAGTQTGTEISLVSPESESAGNPPDDNFTPKLDVQCSHPDGAIQRWI